MLRMVALNKNCKKTFLPASISLDLAKSARTIAKKFKKVDKPLEKKPVTLVNADTC